MHSEHRERRAWPQSSYWAWLHSQELGILCGMSTVMLLAVGSVVLAATRSGASAGIAMDDVRVFFRHPSIVHLWFYLLFGVLAVYALNTLLATWKTVSWIWRRGIRAPQAYAASLVHLAFLVGLLAHLVGGLAGEEKGQLVVGPAWTQLGDGRQARVTAIHLDANPDGSAKQVSATLELRGAEGEVEQAVVRYNHPLSARLGSDLFLLLRAGEVAVAKLSRGGAKCAVGAQQSCRLGNVQVSVAYVQDTGTPHGPVARVQVKNSSSEADQQFWLFEGRPKALGDSTFLTLTAVEQGPVVMLRHRHAPGNPWALLASLLLTAGLLLMWRRFLAEPKIGVVLEGARGDGSRARRTRPGSYWPRLTAGSPKASTPAI